MNMSGNAPSRYSFHGRWKEVLECTTPEGTLLVEMTTGTLAVYLPTESVWAARAPAWAAGDWAIRRRELAAWCAEKGIPLHVDDDAWVESPGSICQDNRGG
jgi:hypothetical protein